MRTIAVLNQKGGVGKTTSVANIAAGLAMKGLRVLVMDMDPQGHLTIHMGADREESAGSYEVLTQNVPIEEAAVQVRENIWVLGAGIDLVGAESELVSVVGREIILREALEPVKDRFDYFLIDCPPSLGLLSLNALTAVKEVFIPLQPHFLALQGVGKLLETVTLVNRRINPGLRITGILLCMYDKRVTLASEVKADIENFLGAADDSSPWAAAEVIPVQIRRNIKLAEAPSHGMTIFEYEPNCNGAADYMAVAEYVHAYMGPNAQPRPENIKDALREINRRYTEWKDAVLAQQRAEQQAAAEAAAAEQARRNSSQPAESTEPSAASSPEMQRAAQAAARTVDRGRRRRIEAVHPKPKSRRDMVQYRKQVNRAGK